MENIWLESVFLRIFTIHNEPVINGCSLIVCVTLSSLQLFLRTVFYHCNEHCTFGTFLLGNVLIFSTNKACLFKTSDLAVCVFSV